MEETETLPSLMDSAAMCEWASMMPGITNIPSASITSAPAGTSTLAPTSAIFPSRIRIAPGDRIPPVTVSTVAPRITVVAS